MFVELVITSICLIGSNYENSWRKHLVLKSLPILAWTWWFILVLNNFNIIFHIPILDIQVFNLENAETNINCIIKYLQIDKKKG